MYQGQVYDFLRGGLDIENLLSKGAGWHSPPERRLGFRAHLMNFKNVYIIEAGGVVGVIP